MIFAKYHYDNLSVPSSKWLGPTGCPETSVGIYHYLLRNNPEERISHLLRDEILKARKFLGCFPTRYRLCESKSSKRGGFTFRRPLIVELFAEMNDWDQDDCSLAADNPYPTAFPYGNGMVLHFYQQQESSTTKTVHKVTNKGLKTYV